LASFGAERIERAESTRSPRRHAAREEYHSKQEHRHSGEPAGIAWADAVPQRSEKSTAGECRDETDCDAGERDDAPLRKPYWNE